jgi:hypothetical protein
MERSSAAMSTTTATGNRGRTRKDYTEAEGQNGKFFHAEIPSRSAANAAGRSATDGSESANGYNGEQPVRFHAGGICHRPLSSGGEASNDAARELTDQGNAKRAMSRLNASRSSENCERAA